MITATPEQPCKHPKALRFADRSRVLKAVQEDGRALEFACEKHRADREVVLTAVRQDGQALQFASEKLRGDRFLVLEAVRQDGHALRFASTELRRDEDVVLEAVREAWHALGFAAEPLKAQRSLVLRALSEDGRALRFAAEALRNDRAIVLEAVRRHGHALQFASEQLRGDREIVLEAVKHDRQALQYLTEDQLRNDEQLSLAVGAFSLQLCLISGEMLALQVYPEQRIARLRRDAAEMLEVEPWSLELCIGGEQLEDRTTVAAAGLHADSVITAVMLGSQSGLDPYDVDLLHQNVPKMSQVDAARALARAGGDVIAALRACGVQGRPISKSSVASSDI